MKSFIFVSILIMSQVSAALNNGVACTANTQCKSKRCPVPTSGQRKCVACTSTSCGTGQVCQSGVCNAALSSNGVACTANDQCKSNNCPVPTSGQRKCVTCTRKSDSCWALYKVCSIQTGVCQATCGGSVCELGLFCNNGGCACTSTSCIANYVCNGLSCGRA